MDVIQSRPGDTLDRVAYRHYGDNQMIALVLAANPQLRASSLALPAGTPVNMPPRRADKVKRLTLW